MSFFSNLIGSGSDTSGNFEVLARKHYKEAIQNKEVQLVDVRTNREFRQGHLARALNIDFYKASRFRLEMEKLDKSKPVYIYCRSGHRSRKAGKRLLNMGFTKVYDLEGGLNNWY